MPRQFSNLYPDICTFENLWKAFRYARRGKRHKLEVSMFEQDLERHLFEIQEALISHNFHFQGYRSFIITDPKERVISAAPFRDRVVHHAICNVLAPLMDMALLENVYACRTGKGTHLAIKKAVSLMKKHQWVLKMDIKKYFYTIDHEILLTKLSNRFLDDQVMGLISKLLATYHSDISYYFRFPQDNLFDAARPRGLPIGNLTSQWFANFYLNSIDRLIKQKLKLPGYVRYMDDFVLFADSKEDLFHAQEEVKKALSLLRLQLNDKKTQIFPVKNGFPFLGLYLRQDRLRILRNNLKSIKQRLRHQAKKMRRDQNLQHVTQSLQAWTGYYGRKQFQYIFDEILSKQSFYRDDLKQCFTFTLTYG